jgi:hypothetical protein
MLKKSAGRPARLRLLNIWEATVLAVAVLALLGGLSLVAPALQPHVALAQGVAADIGENAAAVNQEVGLTTTDVRTYVSLIIRGFMGLLGLVAVLLFLYAGFLWMTAQGNEDKVKTAKKIMVDAVIGLVIILAAYSIAMFIVRLVLGDGGAGGAGGVGGGGGTSTLFASTRGRSELGNGIIEYHYPEPGQMNVARNTKIAITFKRPLALSSVIKNYDDKGTYSLDDDTVGGVPVTPETALELNTDNIRLIAQADLGAAVDGTSDEQFDGRYPLDKSIADPAPSLRKTEVKLAYDALDRQTITVKPVTYLGSASAAVNYRVALRGGDGGVKVWDRPERPEDPPRLRAAFPKTYPDGAYYWNFTTGTVVDTTPPQLTWVLPSAVPDPSDRPLARNQLLQAYFNEAMDPATAGGVTERGYSMMAVGAQCVAGLECSSGFSADEYRAVAGQFVVGNRFRAVEFVPATRCDTFATNSCGDPVYCLPKNVDLRFTALAATVGDEPPAAIFDNGLEDMAGNSFDGNRSGTAEGPQTPAQPAGRGLAFHLNAPSSIDQSATSDTAYWDYRVGSDVDLVPPFITALNPPPSEADYPDGYNRIPPDLAVGITWSKPMSISSIRTGFFDEAAGTYPDEDATVVLRARELEKQGSAPCTASCPTRPLDPPGFFVETEIVAQGDVPVTRLRLLHPARSFLKANDLGFTADDLKVFPQGTPTYVPVARASLKDDRQNCFWPSVYQPASATDECLLGAGQSSCCVRDGLVDGAFVTTCSPYR